jgi:iron(III) transport system substrate-binding protein
MFLAVILRWAFIWAGAILVAPCSYHFTASGTAIAAESSPEVQHLVAAAKERGEQELQLSWGETTLGGSKGAKRFEALFNQMYGSNIRINFTPGPSMPDIAGRVTQELAAGRKAATDVLIGSEGIYASLVDRRVLEEYDYTRLSPRIRKELVAPRDIGVEILSLLPGITYNTTLIPPSEVPKKLEDTLNPKWKGRIASTPYATGLDRVSMRPEWGVERMKAFVRKLSEHVAGLIRSGEQPRIASGEFVMMVMDAGGHQTLKYQAMGMPLGHIIPEDGSTVGFLLFGVPRNSSRPNLAKLFINAILSKEGQWIVYDVHFTDHHELAGSRAAAALAGLKSKRIEPLRIDVRYYGHHPELQQLQLELQKILSQERQS